MSKAVTCETSLPLANAMIAKLREELAEREREVAAWESEPQGVFDDDEYEALLEELRQLAAAIRGQSCWTPEERLAELSRLLSQVAGRVRL